MKVRTPVGIKSTMPAMVDAYFHGSVVLVFVGLVTSGCSVSPLDLSSKRCPCSAGWTCDTATNLCVRGAVRRDDVEDTGDPSAHESDGDAGTPRELEGSDASMRGMPLNSDAGPRVEDAGSSQDAGSSFLCDPHDADCLDPDGDDISDDGDLSGVKGDNPCRDGLRVGCDDNCPLQANPWQDDGDNDGVGDECDGRFCRSSSTIVAVGYGDQVHVSTDHGQSFRNTSPGAAAQLTKSPNWEDVVYGRGTWLTINSTGLLVTWARSVDGVHWTVLTLNDWHNVTKTQGVGYAGGKWFLGSEDGRLAVSDDDGLSFRSIGEPSGWNGTAIESLAFHGGRLIAVGDNGQIAYSDQPELTSTWHTRQVGSGDFKQIVVAAGLWVAAGKNTCYYSDNRGEDWTSCGAPEGTYYGLHYSDGVWMLGALSNGAWVSRGRPDQWTQRVFSSPGGGWPVFGDCGSGRWFAGDQGAAQGDRGLRLSDNEGNDPEPNRVIVGQALPLYGITGN